MLKLIRDSPPAQIFRRVLQPHNIRKSRLDIKQRKLVQNFAAVLHSLTDDDGPHLKGLGVRGGGANAGAGRAAGDQQSIDAPPQKMADERGAGKGTRMFLANDVLARLGLDPFIDFAGALIPLAEFRREIGG